MTSDSLQVSAETVEEPRPDSWSIDWVDLLSALWGSRMLVVKVTVAAAILSVIISLILPEYYRSTAVLLPETEKAKVASLGGLSDLAAIAGVNVGGDGLLAKLYPTIIRSEAVLRNVMYSPYETERSREPVNLAQLWGIDEATPERTFEATLRRLRDELEINYDNKLNVVSISILAREPRLSAAIVNNVTQQLDSFIRTKRTTNATEQRKWIEERLREVKKDLEKSENTLKEFREKNRRLSDSPQLQLELGRLTREVEINSTMYVELKKQNELVKIEEIKNIPIINVMDPGRPAARKDWPKRTQIVLSTIVAAFLLVSLAVAGRRWAQKNPRLPDRVLQVFRRSGSL